MDQELITKMVADSVAGMTSYAFIPGFMLCTVLHLLGYGIFKGLTLLNIRS